VKGIAQHPKKYGAIDHIYIIHMLEVYEENKKRQQDLTDQTGNPDMVRV
jgi:hypothetical protein